MSEQLEGTGHLFDGDRIVAPIQYRLRYGGEGEGDPEPGAAGELMLRSVRENRLAPGIYILQAEAGFSLPVEVTGKPSGSWLPFRRCARLGAPAG